MVYEDSQMKTKSSSATKLDVFTAGLTGMFAGAAGVTLLVLSDKDIRKKVFEHAHTAKEFLTQWSLSKIQEADVQIKEAAVEDATEGAQKDILN